MSFPLFGTQASLIAPQAPPWIPFIGGPLGATLKVKVIRRKKPTERSSLCGSAVKAPN